MQSNASSSNNDNDEWEDEEEFYVVMENKHFESTEALRNCKKYAIAVRCLYQTK